MHTVKALILAGIAYCALSMDASAMVSTEAPEPGVSPRLVSSAEISGEVAPLRWQVMLDGGAVLHQGAGIDVSYTVVPKLRVGLLFSQRRIDGWKRSPKPKGMSMVHAKYYPRGEGGWYVGGGLSRVSLIEEEDDLGRDLGRPSEGIGTIVLGGYELHMSPFGLPAVFKMGLGYGGGAPYIGRRGVESSRRFFAGLFDYTYLDTGLGLRF